MIPCRSKATRVYPRWVRIAPRRRRHPSSRRQPAELQRTTSRTMIACRWTTAMGSTCSSSPDALVPPPVAMICRRPAAVPCPWRPVWRIPNLQAGPPTTWTSTTSYSEFQFELNSLVISLKNWLILFAGKAMRRGPVRWTAMGSTRVRRYCAPFRTTSRPRHKQRREHFARFVVMSRMNAPVPVRVPVPFHSGHYPVPRQHFPFPANSTLSFRCA